MFKLVHKNNKGFSLVELLICVAILALVVPLAGQVLFSFAGVNNNITDKWHVQTAVRLACNEFNAAKDGLTNAYQVDVLYDPIIENGVILNNDGTFYWKGGYGSSYVMNAEGTQVNVETDPYSYIFSAKTWNNEGEYLGELLYFRESGAKNSKLLLGAAGFGDVPIDISFSLASTEFVRDEGVRYTNESIFINFKSGKEDMYPYELQTAFAIVNNMRSINKKDIGGGENLVFDKKWMDASGNPAAYPAGWTNHNINTGGGTNFPSSTTVTNGDGSTTSTFVANYLDTQGAVQEMKISGTYEVDLNGDGQITTTENKSVITREGNLLRYVSPTAQATQGDVATRKSGANIATCLTGWAMMGSSFEQSVLTNLRAFRDNVLKGTTFGDWFIEQYYYVWSPFVVKNLEVLKPVIKAVLIPVSYICGEIAK